MQITAARRQSYGRVILSHLSVSHSVYRGGGLCMMPLPFWLPGLMFVSVQESFRDRDSPGQRPPGQRPPDRKNLGQRPLDRDPTGQRPLCTAKSGQYTSYWNAFLFIINFQYVLCRSIPPVMPICVAIYFLPQQKKCMLSTDAFGCLCIQSHTF